MKSKSQFGSYEARKSFHSYCKAIWLLASDSEATGSRSSRRCRTRLEAPNSHQSSASLRPSSYWFPPLQLTVTKCQCHKSCYRYSLLLSKKEVCRQFCRMCLYTTTHTHNLKGSPLAPLVHPQITVSETENEEGDRKIKHAERQKKPAGASFIFYSSPPG